MTVNNVPIGSDLAKVDAYENKPADYEELPELDEAFFARGAPLRGRPPLNGATKEQVTLRLDPTIRARFRSSGPGWQGRINTFLARNEAVLKMIVDYDESLVAMETLITQLRSGGLTPLHETVEASIVKVERNIGSTKALVRRLREQLVWEPATTVG